MPVRQVLAINASALRLGRALGRVGVGALFTSSMVGRVVHAIWRIRANVDVLTFVRNDANDLPGVLWLVSDDHKHTRRACIAFERGDRFDACRTDQRVIGRCADEGWGKT